MGSRVEVCPGFFLDLCPGFDTCSGMDESNRTKVSFEGNPDMAMADAFIRQTGCHVFLTGKAGTGKTTFLKTLKDSCDKQIMVTAPTGVAAVNAGGVTLHSFFQLPFGPYIPGRTDRENRRFFRFSKEKKRIIKGLDLLVIDEISMVRADLLDAVDAVLRRLRRDDRPFGGVQLLLIGDLFQLPPVAKPDEWQLLEGSYASVYFFASHALAAGELITIELKKIYRQSDEKFIGLLNAVRENRVDGAVAAMLNQCADKPLPDQGYITLTTHNKKADDINRQRLARLQETAHKLVAQVSGEFPEHSFPTPDNLVLKKGAQVMFLRNDPSPEKAFYNGKIGRVTGILGGKVVVSCDPDQGDDTSPVPIEVAPVEWENVAYTVNEQDQTIQQNVIGRFKQIPLKLAWAVTIHKSQGLTFDRAIVDAGNAFAHGQAYVALSRCRALDGLVLSSPVPSHGLGADPAVSEFMAEAIQEQGLSERLETARRSYQQDLLIQCFDCGTFRGLFYYVVRILENNRGVVRVSGLTDIEAFKSNARDEIFGVSDKFLIQLRGLMAGGNLPEFHPPIIERTRKASAWFCEKFTSVFGEFLEKGNVETDNKALAKQINSGLDNLKQEIEIKRAGILSSAQGFSPVAYLRAVSRAGVGSVSGRTGRKSKTQDYTEFDIDHPDMFKALKEWRAGVAKAEGVPHFHILHQKVLVQISVCLPRTESELSALKGVGPQTVKKYGDDLISLVNAYREEKGITGAVLPEPAAAVSSAKKEGAANKKSGPGTREVSLELFASGMSAQEIARERGLALSTIQGHLCHYIEKGKIDVDRLVEPDTQAAIEAVMSDDRSVRQLKIELGNDISYGEIQAVLAHHKFMASGQR